MKRFSLELLITSSVIAAILYGLGYQEVVFDMLHQVVRP